MMADELRSRGLARLDGAADESARTLAAARALPLSDSTVEHRQRAIEALEAYHQTVVADLRAARGAA